MKIFTRQFLGVTFALSCITSSYASNQSDTDSWYAKAEQMLEYAVKVPTVVGQNHVPELAQYFANQFRAAGIPDKDIHIIPYNQTAALIVRWRAAIPTSEKPIMVMGHMDVVEAKKDDWSMDPFTLVKKNGYYYGRGTIDMKDGLVATTVAIMKLKAQGFQNKRDIIVFFTGDEETGGVGAQKGATEWNDLLNAEYGLNADAGGGSFDTNNHPLGFKIQTAEKTYTDYMFTVRNSGGHSSKPRADNAIYQLADALKRLEAYRFQPMMTETTRAYFAAREKSEANALGDAMRAWLKNPSDSKAADIIEADPGEVGLTRTRCVATRLFAGHANNALPQLAQATINCRLMPGVSPDTIKKELEQIVADPNVLVTRLDDHVASLDSPLRRDVLNAYKQSIHTRFPDAPIIPSMSTGATDARPFRIVGTPVYGVNGTWVISPEDLRAHGRDERLPVQALNDNVDHWVRMLTTLAG
ncbi:M20/M25/M40 family metallo-hydrolase [Legionella cherrii]|uniref:Zinc metalloprotein n=1 Tax=Legionella cherrii TaxID=28084 RepID=A0A0W0SAA5_9GAMM|nr:M20/M25/M40 family metallo-hydrolase [Legionella cherrii]KTC80479.1 zinc metalloprotein [Legionella cherrii]VEB39241.1 zinc metalloprotein [Legionella cherrii]